MKRIAVDMDEVLADALSEHLARYNRDHGEAITKGELHGKWLRDIVTADRHERLDGYLRSEDFFEDFGCLLAGERSADFGERAKQFLDQRHEKSMAEWGLRREKGVELLSDPTLSRRTRKDGTRGFFAQSIKES